MVTLSRGARPTEGSTESRASRVGRALARWWPQLAVAALLVVLIVVHALWVHSYRRGLPLDIDEAGYLGFALDDLHGWTRGGLSGLHDAAVSQQQFGPLVPLAAVPLLRVFGVSEQVGMSVQLVFLTVLAFAVYGLGARVAGRAVGALAAAVVLLSPGVVEFTRTFHFVMASTAFLSLTVWALIESEALRRRGHVVVAGVAVGLLLLSRTYSVIFLPGLAIAVAVMLWRAEPARRGRAAVSLLLGGGAAGLVAGWWWVPNVDTVYSYLTSYGYGARSEEYTTAPDASPWGLEFWTARLEQLIDRGLFLVPFLLIGVALVAYAMLRWRDRRRSGPSPDARSGGARLSEAAATPAGTVAIVVVSTYLVLTSSSTEGTGFLVPLVPLVVVLAVACLARLPRAARGPLAGALVVAVLVTAVAKTTVTGALAERRCVDLPVLDCVPVTDGSNQIQRQLSMVGIDATDPDRARRGAAGAWVRASERGAELLHSLSDAPIVFFASSDALFNTNTVGLEWRERYGTALAVGQLRPDDGGDTTAAYLRRLADPRFGQPTHLFSTDPGGRQEFRPRVTQPRAERAAECLGFVVRATFALPDGREVRLHERVAPVPAPVNDETLRALRRECPGRAAGGGA